MFSICYIKILPRKAEAGECRDCRFDFTYRPRSGSVVRIVDGRRVEWVSSRWTGAGDDKRVYW